MRVKKYSVYVLFNNGKDVQFETDTDVRKVPTVHINGGNFIITEDKEAIINVDQIKGMKVVRL
jgi:TRAP-type uncharacterized transport system substrate-binding protein